jgi:hypothetical protein
MFGKNDILIFTIFFFTFFRFGKGEHDFVALLIEEAGYSSASFDDSDSLY